MARYINVDKLSKEVLASWDKDNHHTIEASRVHRQEHHHLMSIIEKQPIADVAPKSEVEHWKEEANRYHTLWCKTYNDFEISEFITEAKTEVAREIFEEIDNTLKSYTVVCDNEMFKGWIEELLFEVLPSEFAELKKKYIPECSNCRHFVGCECFSGKTCDEYTEDVK